MNEFRPSQKGLNKVIRLWQPISFLIPIPGPRNPSTLGYKNLAALAVLGQIFLLLSLVSYWGQKRRWGLVMVGGLIALAEAAYLATLQSRTSYFAFTITMAFVLGFSLYLLWHRRGLGILKIPCHFVFLTRFSHHWLKSTSIRSSNFLFNPCFFTIYFLISA